MADQQPTIGEIVHYRHSSGVDVPAIVTGLAEDDGVHLTQFPPPALGADRLSPQYGTSYSDEALPRTWRPREPAATAKPKGGERA